MRLKHDVVERLKEQRGWSDVKLAQELDLDYSYIYRVMRNQKGIGRKFLARFMKFCEQEGLEFKDYVSYD